MFGLASRGPCLLRTATIGPSWVVLVPA